MKTTAPSRGRSVDDIEAVRETWEGVLQWRTFASSSGSSNCLVSLDQKRLQCHTLVSGGTLRSIKGKHFRLTISSTSLP